MKKVCVLGLGYIGLPTASLLANNGYQVVGVDDNDSIIEIINSGGVHIEEPGLKTIVTAAINSGLLKVKNKPEPADIFFIAVPTPVDKSVDDAIVDLSYVEDAANVIVPHLKKGNLVILESTVPPGTSENLVAPIIEKSGLKVGVDLYLAHCPERVLPGSTLHELIHNNRVVGGVDSSSAEVAKEFYQTFVSGAISTTDANTAEMVKLTENIYRDVNIALANELADICEKSGINIWEVIGLANLHPRVNVHMPGPGVGGHCISVDPWFIISKFKKETRIIKQARVINDSKPAAVVNKVAKILDGIETPVVTVLGVAYKGNIDDTRESPANKVVELLEAYNVAYRVYDPHVKEYPGSVSSLKDAFLSSDLVLLLCDHDEFRYIYPKEPGNIMRNKNVFDTRNTLDKTLWEDSGFSYHLLGSS